MPDSKNIQIIDHQGVGTRLRALRKYTGLSRKTLSSLCGTSDITIRSWENGTVKIREHNLLNYLQELAKYGSGATLEWVLYGDGTSPFKDNESIISGKIGGKVNVDHVLSLLRATSNLLYYLDENENILYIDTDLVLSLGNAGILYPKTKHNIKLQELYNDEVYQTCLHHFVLCHKGIPQNFSYSVGSKHSKHKRTMEMLYWPLASSKNKQILGVLGFITN